MVGFYFWYFKINCKQLINKSTQNKNVYMFFFQYQSFKFHKHSITKLYSLNILNTLKFTRLQIHCNYHQAIVPKCPTVEVVCQGYKFDDQQLSVAENRRKDIKVWFSICFTSNLSVVFSGFSTYLLITTVYWHNYYSIR